MTGKEVVDHKGLRALGIRYCKVHLRRMEKLGEFPLSFQLGIHRNSSRVWWMSEILDWLDGHGKRR